MLYIFDGTGAPDGGFAERWAPYLSDQRREKISAYRFAEDRDRAAAAYLLLRLALWERYGVDAPPGFAYGGNGKPVLRDPPHIRFNLSHCRLAAACAVSDAEVGVDAQEVRPVSDALARRVLTAAEYAEFRASPRPDERFCELWTVKECLLKRTGQGIGVDLSAFPAADAGDVTLYSFPGYRCCVSGASVPLRRAGEKDFFTLPPPGARNGDP
ncbi:MAG: 4'-phosphopantetheinyl transferase superfamily protein [Oscillospiraceae bacterium]|nr:4'-phosphopantetheinyl transferase superfamily protein [Oscillospiraceae bacterium]